MTDPANEDAVNARHNDKMRKVKVARDRMMDFQELADEAFRDLLKKHGRPSSLKEALRRSAGESADVVPFKGKKKSAKTTARKKRR